MKEPKIKADVWWKKKWPNAWEWAIGFGYFANM